MTGLPLSDVVEMSGLAPDVTPSRSPRGRSRHRDPALYALENEALLVYR